MVVVTAVDAAEADLRFERRRFGATTSELLALAAWLQQRGVQEVVMESTAQHWKPVWLALEPQFQLHLAQAQSNRAPGGRKSDFRDAERLVRRLVADEGVGVCPGRNESAGHNRSGHCAKGNRYLRRILCQGAQAAVKKNGSYLQALLRRRLPRLGYLKAIWALAHRLCQIIWKILHEGAEFVEYGQLGSAKEQKRRTRRYLTELRKLGYSVQLNPIAPASAQGVTFA